MNRFLLLSLFSLLSGGLMAQTSDAYWRTDIAVTPSEAHAIVVAISPANVPGTGTTATSVLITQMGAGNRFSYEGAAGNVGNQVSFSQLGNNNQLDFALTGNDNTYSFSQNGNRNVLNLPNVSTSNARLEVQQTGNGNRLDSVGYPFADSSIPLKITQTGGMQLIISTVPGIRP